MKTLRLAFIGLLAGFILSTFAGRSVWLEMRINTGLLLPLTTAVAIIAGTSSNKQVPAMVPIGMEIFLVLLLLLIYGFDPNALLVIPALTFKEGFFLATFDLRTLNSILGALLLLGNWSLVLPRGNSR